ncbi:MAG TPA: TonB-dependent receptor, partial [Novosphingobium sp.]|nr:TonB-dependent receptor [Novosphingobium sp.]
MTANRVETSAQKTATALTVYSGADLTAHGVSNVQALATIDPSVVINVTNGAPTVAVRGISTTVVNEIGDPSVPIARDGFYTNRAFNVQTSMYDIARVEVLKGPQGTLNGRNSTGGLISIVTNRPAKTNGGYASVGYGNYNAFESDLGVNLALADWLQVRASGFYRYHDGYRTITGLPNGQQLRGDDANTASGRFQAAMQPIDGMNIWASYQHDSTTGVGDIAYKSPLGAIPNFGNTDFIANSAPTSNRIQADRLRWELSYDRLPGGLRFIYAGGWDKSQWNHILDATGPAYPAIRQFIQSEKPVTWNHEVRLSNAPSSRLFFQVGYFHFDESNTLLSSMYNVAMTGAFAPGGANAAFSQAGVNGIVFNYTVVTQSNAVFGQIAYRLLDNLKLSFGARETWDSKLRTGTSTIIPAAAGNPFASTVPRVNNGYGSMSKAQPTFHVGIDWQVAPRSLLYAKFDTGYKAGGFNSNGVGASTPYSPETLKTWEAGSKNRFMGNRLELNLAAFYSDYTGYQATQLVSALSTAQGTFNIGSASIYGLEAQLTAQLGSGWQVDANSTWLHTRLGDGVHAYNATTASDKVIGGAKLPSSPAMAAHLGLQKTSPFMAGHLLARAEAKYSSSF